MSGETDGKLFSEADYLRQEEVAESRSEYVLGSIYEVADATAGHNTIVMNCAAALHAHMRENGGRVFAAGMKVRVGPPEQDAEACYYPDIVATSAAPDPGTLYLAEPSLIMEVASPASRRIDHFEKRLAYSALSSLEEYIVIEQAQRKITIYRRSDGFEGRECTAFSGLELESLGLHLPFEDIYANAG